MNKFLAILGILVLVGAGCATKTEVSTKNNATTAPEAQQQTTSTESDSVKAEVEVSPQIETSPTTEPEITTIVGGNNVEMKVKTTPSEDVGKEPPAEENVVDVVLGDEVAQTINMEIGNFFFKPSVINAKPGDRVKLTFTKNAGFHTFVIDNVANIDIAEGESFIFSAPAKAGSYEFYCDVGSHKAMGMKGTLIVK